MGAPELLVLSLGVSVAVAVLAWVAGSLVERLSPDPGLRDRVWASALILPTLPPLAVGLLLLTPAPVREVSAVLNTLPAASAAGSAESATAAAASTLAFDPVMAAWAVLGVAALLTATRLAALMFRSGRLVRIVRQAQAPVPALTTMVEAAARDLGIRPPRVGVSAATSEALLASLGQTRLILPASLTEGTDAVAINAVIAHELAHLKRGDHRALWLEEALLALLAVNPVMPLLRARRAAAREEACDALALANAAPETRRAYARSLIEALRNRAGPQASGGLPALTFIGAGRNTAMHRLKAVLDPVPAAGRGSRLMALGLGGLIAVLAGAGSLAVAAEREAVVRVRPAPVEEQPRTVDLGAGARTLMNGEPLPEGLPMWAVAPERIEIRTPPAGSGEVDFVLPFTGSTPVSVNGRRMPAGFPASGVNPEAVARIQIVGDHLLYTLKPEAEVRRARANTAAEQSAPAPARSTRISLKVQYPENYQAKAGDHLEVRFVRRAGETTHRRAVSFDLSPGAPLDEVSAELDSIYFAGGRSPDLVAQLVTGDGTLLARQAAQPRPMLVRGDGGQAFGSLVFEAVSAPRQDPESRYRGVSAARYRSLCASTDPRDGGFCAGVMFAQLQAAPGNGVCPPAAVADGGDNGPALTDFVNEGRRTIAGLEPQRDEAPQTYVARALRVAFPCAADRA